MLSLRKVNGARLVGSLVGKRNETRICNSSLRRSLRSSSYYEAALVLNDCRSYSTSPNRLLRYESSYASSSSSLVIGSIRSQSCTATTSLRHTASLSTMSSATGQQDQRSNQGNASWTASQYQYGEGEFSSSTVGPGRSTSNGTGNKLFYTPTQKKVMEKCRELHASIMPLNEKLRGPLAPESDRGTALPFVFLVGNHSSGKSSFINYVLGRTIQTAGVAPTDDSFTIIAPGPVDRDQDGPALIGDPDLGFSQLRQFGPTLMHHTALKIRAEIESNFIMVDSPGMIDAPANFLLLQSDANARVMDRGYDFTGVVRWFADRADIVCLFFDPDKPGTTGETLSTLLHALSGMDHKLLIILNKADQFLKIHDFARAYGSLCWNLSKVIPRKDLPRIYTMCLPVAENTMTDPPAGLRDLHTARDEVVAEVRKAPERRMDNIVTHLHDSVSQLHMHATILKDLRTRWTRFYWQCKWQELGVGVTGTALTALLSLYGSGVIPMEVTGAVVASTILGTGGLTWYHTTQLDELEKLSKTPEELSAAFQRTHARQISEGDEYTAAVWQRVRGPLRVALEHTTPNDLSTIKDSDLKRLQDILHTDIPALRRLISPSHYGKEEREH